MTVVGLRLTGWERRLSSGQSRGGNRTADSVGHGTCIRTLARYGLPGTVLGRVSTFFYNFFKIIILLNKLVY